MRVFTRQSLANEVAERWKEQYGNTADGKRSKIFDALKAMPKPVDPDEVDRIIGNSSWTRCHCHECDESVEAAIEIGEPPDYESSTANICFTCFDKAAALVKDAKP